MKNSFQHLTGNPNLNKSINNIDTENFSENKNPKPSLVQETTTSLKLEMLANQNKLKMDLDKTDKDTESIDSETVLSIKSFNSENSKRSNRSNRSNRSKHSNRSNHSNYSKHSLQSIQSKQKEQMFSQPNIKNQQRDNQTQPQNNMFSFAKNTQQPQSERTEKEVKYRKIELLRIFQELRSKGYNVSDYNMNSNIEEMEHEYEVLKSFEVKKSSVKLYKSFLVNIIYGLEFLNDNYNPFDLELDGWGNHVSSNVQDYDEVLGEIYEKYKNTGRKIEPELKLILALAGSAAIFHGTKVLNRKMNEAMGDIFSNSTTLPQGYNPQGYNPQGNKQKQKEEPPMVNTSNPSFQTKQKQGPSFVPSNFFNIFNNMPVTNNEPISTKNNNETSKMKGNKPSEFVNNLKSAPVLNKQPKMMPPSVINIIENQNASLETLDNTLDNNTNTIESVSSNGGLNKRKNVNKINLGI